jgi:hypothetical protein
VKRVHGLPILAGPLLAFATAAAQVKAQEPPKWSTVADILREHEWGDATNNLLDIVAAMPDERFGFRPAPQMRSFGEIVGHIADVQFGFCDGARKLAVTRDSWEKKPAKADLMQGLLSSVAACDSAFDQLGDARLTEPASTTILVDLFVTMLGHTRRETGKLVAYLPIAGIKNPVVRYQLGRVWRKPVSPR